MIILLNNKNQELKSASNLLALIQELNLPEKGIALAVNNQVIPKNDWQSFELSEQMRVTLIRATQGG
jgi:sulfur carrier protein